MFQSFTERTKEAAKATARGVSAGAQWAKTDGYSYAKKAATATKEGTVKGVQWARTDGVDAAKRGAEVTKRGAVKGAEWARTDGVDYVKYIPSFQSASDGASRRGSVLCATAGKAGMQKISCALKKDPQ